ncbi:AraC-like DNA-binding protein [Lipingzhangella halophila]|uniref:AraC-like DNA-binding protein n=1 Tax=Lipingzhangella halophila TaxID=1783352 RepID=A0A7W7RNN2_9ACTN|nr:helix-turn-helix domain-containing protein [Lipingzhangella halophila]MBB4935320.1 AraC-like DNA-binding protein [Lipingzhangella halophila]
MKKRDVTGVLVMLERMEPLRGYPEAIVRPEAGDRPFDVERVAPSAALAEFVDYYWLVRWRTGEPHRQQVIPQPRLHVAAEDGRLLVHGVTREPFFRTLTGTGHVLGAAFHPGGFRPLLKGSVSALSGLVRPGADVLGRDDRPVAARILRPAPETAEVVADLERYLLDTVPEPDATAREVTALVEEARQRTGIVRAEQLAAHAGLGLRSLQRTFAEYVGIGPKWIVRRFRILEAAAAAHAGEPVDWSALAPRLGFSDQAHLTRVFTQVVGTPPATYQRMPGA